MHRIALYALLTFLPIGALAQTGGFTPRAPQSLVLVGLPYNVISHDVAYTSPGQAITSSGTNAPYTLGGYVMGVGYTDPLYRYTRIDVTGTMQLIWCALLDCDTGTEMLNGRDNGRGWLYLDGALLPRAEGGLMVGLPIVGAVGIGGLISAAGANSEQQGTPVGGIDVGIQGAHALEIPGLRLGILTTVTQARTFDGDSQKFDGSSFKIMSDLSLRLTGEEAIGGWLRPALVARYFYDHRTAPTGDFEGTFHGFGFGIGFSSE